MKHTITILLSHILQVTKVHEFIKATCSEAADKFRRHEIDGQAMMLLRVEHLVSVMGFKLGPALKILARINAMREESTVAGAIDVFGRSGVLDRYHF